METYLEALGYSKSATEDKADLIIYNTCSVKQKAEQKVYGSIVKIHQLKRKNPRLIFIMTGCMIRISSSKYSSKRDKLFSHMKELDIALKIEELPRLAELLRELNPKIKILEIKEENLEDYFKIKQNYTSKFQAFLPISTGCDKFCTYCIVPYSRGREKSRKIEDVMRDAQELARNGCKEITLVGQTVDSYGLSAYDKTYGFFKNYKGKEKPFVKLLKEIDKLYEKGLRRLRFTSPHPRDITDDLINAIANLRTLMPYLHLPVQSGDNEVLKRMNRPYTREKYLEVIEKLRKAVKDIAISTDIIVGFCGETDEEFEATRKLFEEVEFDFAYLSPYSERRGTYAAKKMKDDISEEVKKKRWDNLNRLLKKISTKKLKEYEGKKVKVLVESFEKGLNIGRSEHYKTVQFKAKKSFVGKIAPVKIAEAKEWILTGELV